MSTTRYLVHFGLESPPFSKEVGDRDLWLPPSKKALVDELVEAASTRAKDRLDTVATELVDVAAHGIEDGGRRRGR